MLILIIFSSIFLAFLKNYYYNSLQNAVVGYPRKYENENTNEDGYCVAFPSWKLQLPGMIEACIKFSGWPDLTS